MTDLLNFYAATGAMTFVFTIARERPSNVIGWATAAGIGALWLPFLGWALWPRDC